MGVPAATRTAARRATAVMAAVACLLAGCGAADGGAARAAGYDDATEAVPGGQIALARSDLSERVRVPVDEIEVVAVDAVTWPDTSLGCPHPERRYAEVAQPGARIMLEIGGTRYRYHAGGDTDVPFLCERPTAQRGQPIEPSDPRLTDPLRRQTP